MSDILIYQELKEIHEKIDVLFEALLKNSENEEETPTQTSNTYSDETMNEQVLKE